MKRILFVALAFGLAGCSALPIGPVAQPTPVVVIQTVLVPMPQPEQPTSAPAPLVAASPAPEIVVVTATPEVAVETSTTMATISPADITATLPADPGGGLFTNMTRSGDKFSLRCPPDTISFGVSTDNVYVTGVDLWFRIEDRLSVSISTWQFGGSMESDKHGNFTIAFPASRVDPDLRSHRAWFDYQFVGVNKYADAVGRSAKISKQITYTIDCDD